MRLRLLPVPNQGPLHNRAQPSPAPAAAGQRLPGGVTADSPLGHLQLAAKTWGLSMSGKTKQASWLVWCASLVQRSSSRARNTRTGALLLCPRACDLAKVMFLSCLDVQDVYQNLLDQVQDSERDAQASGWLAQLVGSGYSPWQGCSCQRLACISICCAPHWATALEHRSARCHLQPRAGPPAQALPGVCRHAARAECLGPEARDDHKSQGKWLG